MKISENHMTNNNYPWYHDKWTRGGQIGPEVL